MVEDCQISGWNHYFGTDPAGWNPELCEWKKSKKISRVLLDQAVSVIEKNQESETEMVGNWSGRMIESMTISYGIVSSTEAVKNSEGELSVSRIAKTADIRMYERKAMYYRNHGVDRRGQSTAYVALCKLYSKILRINLTEDNYRIGKSAHGKELEFKRAMKIRLQSL